MQLPASLNQDRVVRNLLRQRVLEDVLGVADRRLLVDEFAELQVVENAMEFVVTLEHHRTNQRQRKLTANDGQRLQQVFRIGRQAIDTRGQNSLHRRRYLQRIERARELHRTAVAHQRTLVEQHLHRL